MGQKINPFGYRLGITENHRSKWFSDSNKVGERYLSLVGNTYEYLDLYD